MQGSVYVTLKMPDLENYEIPLPPLKVQNTLAKIDDELQTLIVNTDQIIAKMRADIGTAIGDVFGD